MDDTHWSLDDKKFLSGFGIFSILVMPKNSKSHGLLRGAERKTPHQYLFETRQNERSDQVTCFVPLQYSLVHLPIPHHTRGRQNLSV